jgi:ribokinase
MIVVFGSINLDLIFQLPAIPAPGETVLGPDIRIEPGGKGANQALAAARDGARVVFVGAVGRDPLADAALALLRSDGVDLSRVARVDRASGCAAIFVDPRGRNAIGVGSGANLAARAEQAEDSLLAPGCTVVLQMEVLSGQTAALIRRARARGARIVLNLAPAMPLPADTLGMIDVLVLNEGEAEWLAGNLGSADGAEGLRAALGVTTVRTLGERGVEAAHAAGLLRIAPHPVVAVDTTGAGDCFTGVLAAGLDRGMELEPALVRANVAAALCCTRPGSQATMPYAAETDAALSG